MDLGSAVRLKTEVLGIDYDNVTMQEALETALTILHGNTPAYCVTPNAEIAYEALHDAALCALINHAGLVLPDGAGVVLASKLIRSPLKQKVAGFDFAMALLPLLEQEGKRLYLLGSKPGIADAAAKKLRERYPRLCICGTADGYFTDAQAEVSDIREAEADVVFVCLGAPKQEFFMQQYLQASGARLMIGLGGTLDGIAGTVKRAPVWMQKLQLEWLYRLIKEPRRFGRMLRLPKYVFAALKKRWRG